MDRPVWGRASAASGAPWRLRPSAGAATAAIRADGGDLPGFALRVASLAGVRHRVGGTGPEDAYAWACDGDRLVVAIADGVGSSEGSAAAATAAAIAAVGDPDRAVDAADAAVREAGGATTLVVALIAADGSVALTRVGDSSAFVLSGGVWVEAWTRGADDGTIGTATAALPGAPPVVEAATVTLAVGEALVLVTDGVADPLRDGPTTVAPGLAGALESPVEPLELARLVDFSRQGVGDDRTLLAVWALPAGE